MGTKLKRVFAASAAAALGISLAACGGGGSGTSSAGGGEAVKGGTLYVKAEDPIEKLDPQRTYIGLHINLISRTFNRGLLTLGTSTGEDADTPIPDVATDTGTKNADSTEWSFTIREGVKWQDGEDVTCEDFRYGYSRNFATDQIVDGPSQYPLGFTDIPADKDGTPQYKGPYTKKGQELYDKAVTCDGNTITYRFNKPFPDFDQAVAALHFAAPYRADKDRGAKGLFDAFSNGPYMLEGAWDADTGGTMVRNPEYDAKTDESNSRKALPDKIVFEFGDKAETTYQEILSDSGQAQDLVSFNRMPSTMYTKISQLESEKRYVSEPSPFVAYLWFNQETLDPAVRKALAWSTNREGWINASGGDRKYKPADSINQADAPGYTPNSIWKDVPAGGDAAEAKKILTEAKIKTPVPIEIHYPQSADADKQAAALKDAWDKTGLFNVQLDPEGDDYYTNIQKPSHTYDVGWAGWGTDWPSPATVYPLLFDSRINIQGATLGSDYSKFKNDEFNKLMDQAAEATGKGDIEARDKIYAEADTLLAEEGVYFPLENEIFNFAAGSNVDLQVTPAAASQPDLGVIGLKKP